jgi:predicted transcriptional regulator of viral defense system
MANVTARHPSRRPARERLLTLARRRGVLAARDARRAGIHSQELTRLVQAGELDRVGRGLYRLADRPETENEMLAVVARAVPHGVVCLLSALSFHEVGTELPSAVWLAIERGRRAPQAVGLPILPVHFTGDAFSEGIEEYRIASVDVRIYSIEKTIADLFKYRNKLGVDIAIEALRETWTDRRITMDALLRAARACRVERVMQPYLEAIVS